MIDLEQLAHDAKLTDPELGSWMIDYGNAEEPIRRFAQAVARKCAELCESELEPGSVECAAAIKEAFGLKD